MSASLEVASVVQIAVLLRIDKGFGLIAEIPGQPPGRLNIQ